MKMEATNVTKTDVRAISRCPSKTSSQVSNLSHLNEWREMEIKEGMNVISEERGNFFSLRRCNWTAVAVSSFVFALVCGASVALACTVSKSITEGNELQALNMASETGKWFRDELNRALTPLFSLAQFASQVEVFRDLPARIGPAYKNGSLPVLESYRRDVSGVCDDGALITRFDEIASEIKQNAKMPGSLILLSLLPEAVVCLVHPRVNTEDFPPGVSMNFTGLVGVDFLTDPAFKPAGEAVITSEDVIVVGPKDVSTCVPELEIGDGEACHPMVQKAFFARLPIRVPYHTIEVNGKPYKRWGFAVVKLLWSELLERSGIFDNFKRHGFEFRLTRTDAIFNATTNEHVQKVVVLAESSDFETPAGGGTSVPVSTTLMTANDEWTMTVLYDPERHTEWKNWVIPLCVFLSACIAILTYVVLQQKHNTQLLKGVAMAQESKVETERNMTAYFAHELRNPLGAIDSALQAMPEGLPNDAVDLVSGMQLCSKFMTSIMNNLMDVRRMEEGAMELHYSPFNLQEAVAQVYRMFLPSVKSNVEFTVLAPSTEGSTCQNVVLGDPHRFEQVLMNIVSNAIKYTHSGSIQLSIGWTPDNKNVNFVCADTGPGIPLADQEGLFKRFVKRGGAPGSGLGLAISKHIIHLMDGTISVISDPQVRPGSTFVVSVPLKPCKSPKDEPAVQVDGKPKVPEPIQESLHILVVDDIKMNRTMLKQRFKKGVAPNCAITEASTGEVALQLCERDTFDVIIMDQYMEEAGGAMLGTDTVIALKRLGVSSLIIGCSGNDMEKAFLDAGATHVWKKPMPNNATIIEQLRNCAQNLTPVSEQAPDVLGGSGSGIAQQAW